jgi:DNA/RNA endonuclease G (NUC1)
MLWYGAQGRTSSAPDGTGSLQQGRHKNSINTCMHQLVLCLQVIKKLQYVGVIEVPRKFYKVIYNIKSPGTVYIEE